MTTIAKATESTEIDLEKGTHMYARKPSELYRAPGSLESMGYAVDGFWTDIQSGSETYRVPRLVISLLPAPFSEGAAAAPIHLTDVESSAAEINCTILNEVRKAADGSTYLVPRLRITVQVRESESANHLETAR